MMIVLLIELALLAFAGVGCAGHLWAIRQALEQQNAHYGIGIDVEPDEEVQADQP